MAHERHGLRSSYSTAYTYPSDDYFEYHLVDSEVMTQYDFGCLVTPGGAGTTEVTVSEEIGIRWGMPKVLLDKNAKKGVDKLLKALKAKAEEEAQRLRRTRRRS